MKVTKIKFYAYTGTSSRKKLKVLGGVKTFEDLFEYWFGDSEASNKGVQINFRMGKVNYVHSLCPSLEEREESSKGVMASFKLSVLGDTLKSIIND